MNIVSEARFPLHRIVAKLITRTRRVPTFRYDTVEVENGLNLKRLYEVFFV